MSSKLQPYTLPAVVRSPLFKTQSDVVPPIDDLESLHAELQLLRQKTLERAKKAGDDLKTIEESMRRAKEKAKGKAKAADGRLLRDHHHHHHHHHGLTPLADVEEKVYPINGAAKARPTPLPTPTQPSLKASQDPRRPPPVDPKQQKKKKRKREDDSDAEDPAKAVKTVPTPSALPPKPKAVGTASNHAKSLHLPDFTIPPLAPLLPTRPPVPPAPIPGPSQPTHVSEDFSKLKQPSQTPVNTFYTSIEPWIRGIKEEDVGFLEFSGDDVEPYVMPNLGRHYLEQWEEVDTKMYGAPLLAPHRTNDGLPLPKWDPSTLAEVDLSAEERSHGPLTERLISALLPIQDAASSWKGVKAAEDAMEGRPGGTGAAAARREKVNVADLEDRIQDTMRFHGLLGEPPDYSARVDDPIATALRHAQTELRKVVAMNKARKLRLASIAKDRLGYQEYLELRDTLDKNLVALYGKLQKKDAPKLGKKKKKGPEMNGNVNGAGASVEVPKPPPAAVGLGPDDDFHLVVPDQLRQLVETRRQWVTTVGGIFDDKERTCPGRIWGLPLKSIYEGLDEAVQRDVHKSLEPSGVDGDSRTTSTHPSTTQGDEMDVG